MPVSVGRAGNAMQVGRWLLSLILIAAGSAAVNPADDGREWVFVVCVYHDPAMLPYLLRPIGEGVRTPTLEACEAARKAVLEWTSASGEVYVVGQCQRAEERAKVLSCPQAPN
jgi:hypothetical protein